MTEKKMFRGKLNEPGKFAKAAAGLVAGTAAAAAVIGAVASASKKKENADLESEVLEKADFEEEAEDALM
ncbi:MAG: hypothetical protein U0K95_00330 [Eubacterium sp.]|nr:hypothetical protein [Eubacterium sp.]